MENGHDAFGSFRPGRLVDISGVTFADMPGDARAAEDEGETASLKESLGVDPCKIKLDQYVLVRPVQDRQAAHRWNALNEVRRKMASVTDKVVEYFSKNVGEQITGKELICFGRSSTDLHARWSNPQVRNQCRSGGHFSDPR